jgi:hypothetical protein
MIAGVMELRHENLSHLVPQNHEHDLWEIKLCSIVLRKHQYTTLPPEQSLLTTAWSNPIVIVEDDTRDFIEKGQLTRNTL